MMKNRLISLLLFMAVAFSCITVVSAVQPDLENFQRVTTYREGCFSDVSASDWYATSVQEAFELGLMKGQSADTFGVNETLTVAETIALAARLHSIYNGNGDNFEQGSPWYQAYVDYSFENGLLSADYSDYLAPIYRGDFAYILGNALPKTALEQTNTIEDGAIPDVPKDSYIYNSVYRLYRAGVLTGNDEKGTFAPNTTITRSAVAAIIARMADKSQRKSIMLNVDYRYLVASDFRRIRREYPSAVADYGVWAKYTNSKGQQCVVTYVQYTIRTHWDECTLHNLTTGETTVDPKSDFNRQLNRAYGAQKLALYDLYEDFLYAYQAALNKYQAGDYVGAEYLNL